MNALVVERAVRGPEELGVRRARVLAGVVLARQKVQRLDLDAARELPELGEAFASHGGVVRRVREVAREDDEVWLGGDAVDRLDGRRKHDVGLGVGHARVAPVRVGELQEEEVGVGVALFFMC